jgi:hypothetical protein
MESRGHRVAHPHVIDLGDGDHHVRMAALCVSVGPEANGIGGRGGQRTGMTGPVHIVTRCRHAGAGAVREVAPYGAMQRNRAWTTVEVTPSRTVATEVTPSRTVATDVPDRERTE